MGGTDYGRWKILGGKGVFHQEQAVQPLRYSVYYEKAMVERMKSHYKVTWFPENGASFPLRVFLYKDIVTIGIDTSGDSLHKRGYRTLTSKAPIRKHWRRP